MARDYLSTHANKKYEVIGGYLSPVSDGYLKKGLLSANHRIGMCQKALENCDWLEVDAWEAQQPAWTRTSLVLASVEERLNKPEILKAYTNGRKIQVMLVSGGDLVGSFLTPGLWDPNDVCHLFLLLFVFRL